MTASTVFGKQPFLQFLTVIVDISRYKLWTQVGIRITIVTISDRYIGEPCISVGLNPQEHFKEPLISSLLINLLGNNILIPKNFESWKQNFSEIISLPEEFSLYLSSRNASSPRKLLTTGCLTPHNSYVLYHYHKYDISNKKDTSILSDLNFITGLCPKLKHIASFVQKILL